MEKRSVNVERFDAAFRAMLRNADFDMDEGCNCLVGSHNIAMSGRHPVYSGRGNYRINGAEFYSISLECFIAIHGVRLTYYSDPTDAAKCIDATKRLVTDFHGPQPWLPLIPDSRSAHLPTLREFVKTLGVEMQGERT